MSPILTLLCLEIILEPPTTLLLPTLHSHLFFLTHSALIKPSKCIRNKVKFTSFPPPPTQLPSHQITLYFTPLLHLSTMGWISFELMTHFHFPLSREIQNRVATCSSLDTSSGLSNACPPLHSYSECTSSRYLWKGWWIHSCSGDHP